MRSGIGLASGCAMMFLEENGGLRCGRGGVGGVLGRIASAACGMCQAFVTRIRAMIVLHDSMKRL